MSPSARATTRAIRVVVDVRRRGRRGRARPSSRASRPSATRCRSGRVSARGRVGAASARRAADAASLTGVDLAFTSDVPVGAGLSSSAAIEGASASALDDDVGPRARPRRPREGRPHRRERGRRRADRDHGPDGVDARASRRRDLPRLPLARGTGRRPRLRRRRPRAARDRHGVKHSHATGGYGERRASCEPGAADMGVPALRDVAVDDLPRAAELHGRRHVPPRAAHRDREPAGARHRPRRCANSGPERDRRSARRLARVDARRLRDLGARARHGGRGGARRRRRRRPHDRRRLRRRRDRPRRARSGRAGDGCRDRGVRGIRFRALRTSSRWSPVAPAPRPRPDLPEPPPCERRRHADRASGGHGDGP